MFTFEQIENHLYKAAIRFYNKFPNKYEVDEIVNIIWVMGNVQKLNNIKYVSGRAYYDMMDHVREQDGSKAMRDGVINDRVREINNMHHRDPRYEEADFFGAVVCKEDFVEYVDSKNEVEFALSCLTDRDAKIIKKYYLEESILKEIAEQLDLSEGHVSSLKKRALKKIIDGKYITTDMRLTESQKKKNCLDGRSLSRNVAPNINNELEEILPEYVADFEIDNECAIEEEFVLERDWE